MVVEENNYSEKSWFKTLLLCWVAGIFGAHRTYVGKKKTAWIQFFTLGGLGIWAIIDLYLIATQKFTDSNDNKVANNDQLLMKKIGIICIILCALNVLQIKGKMQEIKLLDIFAENNIMSEANIDASMEVRIERDASEYEIQKLKLEIGKIDGIESIKFHPKEENAKAYLEEKGDKAYLFEPYIDMISNTYVVTVNNIHKAEKISNEISGLQNVKNVYLGDELSKLITNEKSTTKITKAAINIRVAIWMINILELGTIGIILITRRKNEE